MADHAVSLHTRPVIDFMEWTMDTHAKYCEFAKEFDTLAIHAMEERANRLKQLKQTQSEQPGAPSAHNILIGAGRITPDLLPTLFKGWKNQ